MANEILQSLPHLRVVFMSGYTEHVLTSEGEVDPQLEYLQKPFTLQTLTGKLEQRVGEYRKSRGSQPRCVDETVIW